MRRLYYSLEEGWSSMEIAVAKLKRILEDSRERFTSEEYMTTYTTIYNMCTQKPPYDFSVELYDKYKGAFVGYINSTVIPSLREKSDELLLKEFVRRWNNHKVMVRWLALFFHYLDRYYIPRRSLPPLREAGLSLFLDLVYGEFNGKARDVVIAQINQERDGNMIDKASLKEMVDMYVELGMKYYKEDFEKALLDDAAAYYSRKASQWIVEDSCPVYMIKVEECLMKEKARVSHYLHSSTETKLLERVQEQLLTQHYKELLHKENSGCRALLRDKKMEDLSRMNRLFQKVPEGLQQLVDTFKQHVSDEGMVLIKQADDAMSNKELVPKFIELHDKFLAYVTEFFSRGSKFDKALKEVFESFCNKVVGGCTTAEMLNQYCDEIFSRIIAEGKLSPEATQGSLDKAVSLLTYISKDQQLADTFKQHISNESMVLLKQADDVMGNKAEKTGGAQAVELVTKIIELHDRFLAYVNDCFSRGSKFHKALKEAFESLCNKNVGGCTTAEMLAIYCDDILKKGVTRKLSNEATEGSLDRAVSLLTYISDKDLFAEFYRKKLARRLLFDKSAQDDHERCVLVKMKQLFGGHFTSKLEGMVTDMILAKENQNKFQQYLSDENIDLGLDLSVKVIAAGFWPSYKSSDLNLPAEMANCVQVFKDYYQCKSDKRKLTWISSLGNCIIKGNFQKKPIELVVATYQAAVLLLFNDADRLSYSEIKTQLNLGDDDLIRLLHSLSCSKYKILNKDPNTKYISTNDYFDFNSNFTDKMRRIKVSLPPAEERKKVIESVKKDRRFNIDAALVRIMKSCKVLPYQQLIAECVEQLSKTFKPEVKDIKMRIEDLITREYMERDEGRSNIFKYLP